MGCEMHQLCGDHSGTNHAEHSWSRHSLAYCFDGWLPQSLLQEPLGSIFCLEQRGPTSITESEQTEQNEM